MQRMNRKFNLNKGFTLIELMVVVAIIAILSMIGLAVFTGAQKKAKDAKLGANIKAYQAAMVQKYFNSTTQVYADVDSTNFASGGVPSGINLTLCGDTGYCLVSDSLKITTEGNCTDCTCSSGSGSITAGTGKYCARNQQ